MGEASSSTTRQDVHADADVFAAAATAQRGGNNNITGPTSSSRHDAPLRIDVGLQGPKPSSALRDLSTTRPSRSQQQQQPATSSTSIHEMYRQHVEGFFDLRVSKSHDPNIRGQPVELRWRVPVDAILRLRARDASVVKPQLTEPSNAVTSQSITLNGLPLFIRLTRILRDDVPHGGSINGPSPTTTSSQSNESSAASSPTRRFEHHVVSCHLISAVPAGGTPLTSALLSRSGTSAFAHLDPSGGDDGGNGSADDDAHNQVQQMERQSWERKVSFLTEITLVPRQQRAIHPAIGASSSVSASSSLNEPTSRVRRVVEGVLSTHNRSIGFSNLIPLRELLMYHVALAPSTVSASLRNPTASSAAVAASEETDDTRLCFIEFTFKIFLSHAWQECIARHNKAAAMSKHLYNLVGLKNHGSTCYINVLIQSLFHIAFFRREVMALTSAGRRKSEAALQLQRIFYELEHSRSPVDTMGLLKAIKVNPSIQNDTHEFLSEFFLHRVFKNITDMFSFKVKYLTTCQDVDFTSTSEETLFELSLCVGAKYPTLESAVQKEFAKEPISDLYDTGVHEFGKQKASRQMCMVTYPPILFVHSKRFDHFAKKVHAAQTFPLSFEVAPGRDYHLHSVIVHHGTGVNSGHFTAFVRVSDAARLASQQQRASPSASSAQSDGAPRDTSVPSAFFHFDDEAVYAVPTTQVLEEMVGIHWSNPSSSAYILVYIESDAFVEATVNFDPTPPDVRANVEKMFVATSAGNSPMMRSINRSPPPMSASSNSPRPSVFTASTTDVPQNQLPRAPTPPPPIALSGAAAAAVPPHHTIIAAPSADLSPSTNSSTSNRRRTAGGGPHDASDMPRLLSACRELRECDPTPAPPLSRNDIRKIRVTMWSLTGLREVMAMLGIAHDIVDMRYVPKYLRQETQLHSSKQQSDSGHEEQHGVQWGTDGAVCSLLLPFDTTIAELRLLVDNAMEGHGVFPVRQQYNNSGDSIGGPRGSSSTTAEASVSSAELFAFYQRRNGTWRPAYPVFDTCVQEQDEEVAEDGAFETPRRENDSVFSTTNQTNISGSFTVRRRVNIHNQQLDQIAKPRRAPPSASLPAGATLIPVTLADLSNEVLALHALSSDLGVVSELHLFAGSATPIQALSTSDAGVMSPMTASHASATPLYGGSVHARGGPRYESPLMRGGPNGSSGGNIGAIMSSNASVVGVVERITTTNDEDDQVNASLTSFGDSAAVEPSMAHAITPQEAEEGSVLLVSNPIAMVGGIAVELNHHHHHHPSAAAAATSRLPNLSNDSPLILQASPASFLYSLSGTTDSGNSAMLILKSSVGASSSATLKLMGAFYVPLDWNLLRLVVTLLQCGYLDWAPLSAMGIASYRVQHLMSVSQRSSSWTHDDRELLTALQDQIQLFEEVRPERLDELQDWLTTSIESLSLDHGDILIVHQQHARSSAPRRRKGQRAPTHPSLDESLYSDEEGSRHDNDEERDAAASFLGSSSLLIAQALVASCRRLVLGCTVLSPLWGTLAAGSTVFCPVDLQYMDGIALEALFLAKLREVALFMGAHESDMAALQQPTASSPHIMMGAAGDSNSSPVSSSRLPNIPSPQHNTVLRNGAKSTQYCWSWWCVDTSVPPKVQSNPTTSGVNGAGASPPSTESRVSLSHRARVLKQARESQLLEVNHSLSQTASTAALQVGSSGAPISLLATLFPTACTTLLQWGEWILPGSSSSSASPSGIAPATKALTAASTDPRDDPTQQDFVTPTRRPSSSVRPAGLVDGDAVFSPPALFDVSASMASRNFRMPWNQQEDRGNSAPQPHDASGTQQLAALHPAIGLLLSSTQRLFVDLRLVHNAAPSTITTTAVGAAAATTQKKTPLHGPLVSMSSTIDIVILWFGWCKASPTHRFRLRAVDLSSSAFTVFSLAAQFLGFLDGVIGSCSVQDDAQVVNPQCLHDYPLFHQLVLGVIGSSGSGATSVMGSSVTASSSPTLSDAPSSGANLNSLRSTQTPASHQPHVGAYRKLFPLISLLSLHDAHGCTAPPLRSDILVADLLRMLGVHTVAGRQGGGGGNSPQQPVVELALLLLPNAPMDMEESFRHPSDDKQRIDPTTNSSLHTTSTKKSVDPTRKRKGLLRSVDVRRSACMLSVCVVRRSTMQAIAFPGLIPASDTIDELRLWLDQLYPPRQVRGVRDAEILLEVHVPPQMQGIHPSVHDFHDAAQCDYWLPRDVNEYCQRLYGAAAKRSSSSALSTTPNSSNTTLSGVDAAGANAAAAAAVPSVVNHRKYSVSFMSLEEEDPEEYRALVQRSVTFHHHLMRKSVNGLNPMEHFEVKKVLLLFPARLLVIVP